MSAEDNSKLYKVFGWIREYKKESWLIYLDG